MKKKKNKIIKIIKRKMMVEQGVYDGRYKTKTHKSKNKYSRKNKHKLGKNDFLD